MAWSPRTSSVSSTLATLDDIKRTHAGEAYDVYRDVTWRCRHARFAAPPPTTTVLPLSTIRPTLVTAPSVDTLSWIVSVVPRTTSSFDAAPVPRDRVPPLG